MQKITVVLAAASVLLQMQSSADAAARDEALVQTIRKLDRDLFDASLRCDIATFAGLLDEDFEFYHDRTGLTVGKAALVENTRKNLCGKVRRDLVEPSLEVFPLENYGAVETGTHMFCNLVETPVCQPRTSGTGRFVMLWRKRASGFKLARVISYDHVDSWQRESNDK